LKTAFFSGFFDEKFKRTAFISLTLEMPHLFWIKNIF